MTPYLVKSVGEYASGQASVRLRPSRAAVFARNLHADAHPHHDDGGGERIGTPRRQRDPRSPTFQRRTLCDLQPRGVRTPRLSSWWNSTSGCSLSPAALQRNSRPPRASPRRCCVLIRISGRSAADGEYFGAAHGPAAGRHRNQKREGTNGRCKVTIPERPLS